MYTGVTQGENIFGQKQGKGGTALEIAGLIPGEGLAAKGSAYLGKGVMAATPFIVKGIKGAKGSSLVPNLGKKLNFVFGKATGRLHNIQRSTTMQRQLNSIGIFDNASGRSYLNGHLGEVLNNSKNILSSERGFITRESLLMGPNGGLKMHSIWQGQDLITIKLMGR